MRFIALVGLIALCVAGTASAIPANLPQLTSNDISVTNNLEEWNSPGRITFEIQGETCERMRIFLDVNETEKVSCAGATYYTAYLHVRGTDGVSVEKTVRLPAGAHYWYGWDTDFRTLTLIDIRLR